jgi:hypothetical protein
MNNLEQTVKNAPQVIYHKGVDSDHIKQAERELSLKFADDYIEYLSKYGQITFRGHEMTGLVSAKRINVVECTKFERESKDNFPSNMYIIEDTHFEGLIITQDSNGKVYELYQNGKRVLIHDSLSEYIKEASKD